jgi:hypothetical protein
MTQQLDLGKAVIYPDTPVTAGSLTTIRFVYTTGHCIDDTGYIRISFRYAGDFGTPQFDHPEAPNFCSVQTTGDCRIEPRWDPKGNVRPWGKSLYLKVMGGYLDQDDDVIITFGDTSHGSSGWYTQTFTEKTFEFKTEVDCFATFRFKELADSPVIQIIPDNPVTLACIAPSVVPRDTGFQYHTRLQDKWGNIVEKAKEHNHPGYPHEGIHEIVVEDKAYGLNAVSNPIRAVSEHESLRLFWGDLHGQSEETIGTNSIEDYFTYARDFSKVDIAAHQGNDFQISDEFWNAINATTANFYKPGSFVTFPGYEWSGNTPLGGDRNVYFKNEGNEITRSHHDLLLGGASIYPESPTAKDLFTRLPDKNAFVFAHVGGRYSELSLHQEGLEIAIEVHSAWGTFEWLVAEALHRGYRIGICANSDGHKGRPGASFPGAGMFGSLGGLTCFIAEKLDRDHIYEAIMKHHFYATTGNRPILSVHAESPDGRIAMMGDVLEIKSNPMILHVHAIGTHNIERIEFFNGPDEIEARRPYSEKDLSSRLKIIWSGAEVRGRGRMVNQDGNLTLEGNSIRRITPINFWNPLKTVDQTGPDRLSWESGTTGGLAGMILDLEDQTAGRLEIHMSEIRIKEEICSINITPTSYRYGGLDKKLELYRLPSESTMCKEFQFSTEISDLKEGDNPLRVRVTQEDGHLFWSSPIYVVQEKN